jgi:hypothetical protein
MLHTAGKSEYLGADLLFPLLVGVLTHSRLPNVHLILVPTPHTSAVPPITLSTTCSLTTLSSPSFLFSSFLFFSLNSCSSCTCRPHCAIRCYTLPSLLFSCIVMYCHVLSSIILRHHFSRIELFHLSFLLLTCSSFILPFSFVITPCFTSHLQHFMSQYGHPDQLGEAGKRSTS